MAEQPSAKKEIKVAFPETLKGGVYANNMFITHTKEEFVLDFMMVTPPVGTVTARVVTSPGHMKRMVAAMTENLKKYEQKFGIKFLGWYNVAYGWDYDNVILLELPDYATIDKLEADAGTAALGHRAGEWIFERHHAMFLRERMGPDLEYFGIETLGKEKT